MARSLFLAVLTVLSVTHGAGADQIGIIGDEVVDCSVTKIEGSLHSYIPPKVGSKMRLDLATEEIQELLVFDDGSRISFPEVSVLKRTPPQDPLRSHQMFFLGSSSQASVQVIVGAYGRVSDPLAKRTWGALIQLLHGGAGSEWSLSQAFLSCELWARSLPKD